MKIYCPKCEYVPTATDVWECVPTCRTIWNTFATNGRCPTCRKQWTETCCPACGRWSPHEDWYHDEVTDEALEEALERLERPEPIEVGAGT
jgi:hypothetical protein